MSPTAENDAPLVRRVLPLYHVTVGGGLATMLTFRWKVWDEVKLIVSSSMKVGSVCRSVGTM